MSRHLCVCSSSSPSFVETRFYLRVVPSPSSLFFIHHTLVSFLHSPSSLFFIHNLQPLGTLSRYMFLLASSLPLHPYPFLLIILLIPIILLISLIPIISVPCRRKSAFAGALGGGGAAFPRSLRFSTAMRQMSSLVSHQVSARVAQVYTEAIEIQDVKGSNT